MADTKCTGDHVIHLCAFAQQGTSDNIKKLSQDPYYLCMNCGRAADSEENLCNPLAYDKIPVDIAG